MKVYIFGAGASQASQDRTTFEYSHPQKSPLTNELFNPQYKEYIEHGISLDQEECLNEVLHAGSVENWLTGRWSQIDAYPLEEIRHAERTWFGNLTFYMWNMLNNVSSTYPQAPVYSELLLKLKQAQKPFSLISFNYDTLLDRAYQDIFGSTLSRKEKYLDAKFYKPHGSVNWFLKQRPTDIPFGQDRHFDDLSSRMRESAENLYNGASMKMAELEIHDPKSIILKDIESIFSFYRNQGYVYPLMFMPLTQKNYAFVEEFESIMISSAKAQLEKATDIYLIGYSAGDELIHLLLKSVKPHTKLHVVGRSQKSVDDIKLKTIEKNPNLIDGQKNYTSGFPAFVRAYFPFISEG